MNKKITISNDFAIAIVIIIVFILGYSFWLGSKYEDYKIVNPHIHIKKFNEIRNLRDEKNQMANPASVYCIEKRGKLEIKTVENGDQTGYCKFDNGKECEEWAFFRGECKK